MRLCSILNSVVDQCTDRCLRAQSACAHKRLQVLAGTAPARTVERDGQRDFDFELGTPDDSLKAP